MDNASYLNSDEFESTVEIVMPFYSQFHRQTLELLKEMNYKNPLWLDTGCGPGMLIDRALEAFPDAGFVLADPSQAMADVARAKFKGNERIKEIRTCGSQDIGEDSVYDIITAIQCHHYLDREERADAVRKCYNALKEGGTMVIFELTAPDTELGLEIIMKRWRSYQIANGRTDEQITEHLARYGVSYFPIKAGEQLELLRNTGFKNAELFWRSHLVAGFYAVK